VTIDVVEGESLHFSSFLAVLPFLLCD
jgi:hypothetical protein